MRETSGADATGMFYTYIFKPGVLGTRLSIIHGYWLGVQ